MNTTATEAMVAQIVRQGTGWRAAAEGSATPSDGRPTACGRRGWSPQRAGVNGVGHERYVRDHTIDGHRPVDELARRLFAHGGVDAVHIYDNMVTADLSKGADGGGLIDVIRELFLYYRGEPSEPPTA